MPLATPPTRFATCHSILIICGLVICFLAQASWFLVANSQTFDEAVHVAAGYRYLSQQDFQFNREHPPLTKLLSALPAFLSYDLSEEEESSPISDQWSEGVEYLYRSPVPASRLLTGARLSNIALGALLIVVVASWSWHLWGPRGAVFSAALLAFDPNIVAHSCLATTDLGAAFFFVATLAFLWSYVSWPRWSTLLIVGSCLGGALASKFSMVALLPAIGFILLAYPLATNKSLLPSRSVSDNSISRSTMIVHSLACVAAMFIVAEFVLWSCYLYGDVSIWLVGVADQWRHQLQGHPAFLLGAYSSTGWLYYFLVAILVKTPLGTLAAFLFCLAILRGRIRWQAGTALVFIVPFFVFSMAACCARTNIGLRYVLPIYALSFVLLGALAAEPKTDWRVLLCWVLAGATAAESLAVAPHQLSFFNAAVGGPSSGHQYLSDSNLDWGQDLAALSQWLQQRGNPAIYLSYFGTAPPEYFGIRFQPLPTFNPASNAAPPVSLPDANQELLAISMVNLQGVYFDDHELFGWLRTRKPLAEIGHSILVFDLAHDGEAHECLARIYEMTGRPDLAQREKQRAHSP